MINSKRENDSKYTAFQALREYARDTRSGDYTSICQAHFRNVTAMHIDVSVPPSRVPAIRRSAESRPPYTRESAWSQTVTRLERRRRAAAASSSSSAEMRRSSIGIWEQKTISRNQVTNPVRAHICTRVNNRNGRSRGRTHACMHIRTRARTHTRSARLLISRACPRIEEHTVPVGLLTRSRNGTRTRLARTPEIFKGSSRRTLVLRSAPPFLLLVRVRLSAPRLVFDMTHACNAVRYVY